MKKATLILLLNLCIYQLAAQPDALASSKIKAYDSLSNKLAKEWNAKEYDSARFTIDKMLEIAPLSEKDLYNKGVLFLILNNRDSANINFEKAAKLNPSSAQTLYITALNLLNLGRFEESIKYSRQLYDIEKLNIDNILLLGHNFVCLKDSVNAATAYKFAIDNMYSDEIFAGLTRDLAGLHELGYIDVAKKVQLTATVEDHKKKAFKIFERSNGWLKKFYEIEKRLETTEDIEQAKLYMSSFLAEEGKQRNYRTLYMSNFNGRLGNLAFNQSNSGQAFEYFRKSIEYDRLAEDYYALAKHAKNLARLYDDLNREDSSYFYYKMAADALEKLPYTFAKIERNLLLGKLSRKEGKNSEAITYFDVATILATQNRHYGYMGEIYNLLESVVPDNEKSKYLKMAANSAVNSADYEVLESIYTKLAIALYNEGKLQDALKYSLEALELAPAEKKKSLRNITHYSNIAEIYMVQQDYKNAEIYLNRIIEITENNRSSYRTNDKSAFFSDVVEHYNKLCFVQMKQGKYTDALYSTEMTRSRQLSEELAGDNRMSFVPDYKSYPATLKDDEIVIVLSNTDKKHKVALAFDNKQIYPYEISDSLFLAQGTALDMGEYLNNIFTNLYRNLSTNEIPNFRYKEMMIFSIYYQISFAQSTASGRGIEIEGEQKITGQEYAAVNRELAKLYYNTLLKPIEAALKNKKKIYLSIDGRLSLIPFETLRDGNGIFLGEKYEISYIPSITVSNIIKSRVAKNYSVDFIGIGGSLYEAIDEKHLPATDKRHYYYNKLGTLKWSPLPGALSEVKAIAAQFAKSHVYIEKDASEDKVEDLNSSGLFKNARIIHFATHGMVDTDIPENSAIVLNQLNASGQKNDGYLTCTEVEKMKIDAELISLSACETGLGSILPGEGVLGLRNSFLRAGARHLLVSLWAVSDESTEIFMKSFYQKLKANNYNYTQSLAEVKKEFIGGKYGVEYKNPYYWAAFVLY